MINLNIARVPESVCKEMLEKGKGKAVADASDAVETQSSSPIKQVESNESSNSAQNYQLGILQGSNNVTANFADQGNNNELETPMQSETSKNTTVDPNQMQNTHHQNMAFSKEGNHEDNYGNNENNEIDDISPPPLVQVPPSPGVWSDFNEIFPPLDTLGDDIPWSQKIQDTPIWEWDDLYFP